MENVKLNLQEPIGYLRHKYTHVNIAVYTNISLFKRLMISCFFGLKYIKNK